MQEKVTVKELLAIPPGKKKVFRLPSELSRHSAKTTAYLTSRMHPREDVSRYSCASEERGEDGSFPLAITAVKK